MASTALVRALRRCEFAASLRHLSGKTISPPGQKWASLTRSISSNPTWSDVIAPLEREPMLPNRISELQGREINLTDELAATRLKLIQIAPTERERLLLNRISELQAREINPTDELTAGRLKIQLGEMEEKLKKGKDQLAAVNAAILKLEQTKKQPPKSFSTASDNQTQVDVKVFQGEREPARDNTMSAQRVRSSRVPFGLQIIVEVMVGLLRGDDLESAELIVAKNVADSMIYIIEKGLSEDKDQIPAEVASEIESAVANLRTASAGDDLGRIQEALDAAKKPVSEATGIQRKLLIDVKNSVDCIIYIIEKGLSVCKDKIPAEVASEIESAVANVHTALAGDDAGRIKETMKETLAAVQKAVSKQLR